MSFESPLFLVLALVTLIVWIYSLYLIGTSNKMEMKDKALWFFVVFIFPLVGSLVFLIAKPHQK